jgi:hypothetical protein
MHAFMPDWWDWDAAAAVATFLAVLAALYGDKWKNWRFPASLGLELHSPLGQLHNIVVEGLKQPDGSRPLRPAKCRMYYLRVYNATTARWPQVKDVRVLLLRIEEPDAAGNQLKTLWAGEMPLRWAHQEVNPFAKSVGPEALCELLNVVEDKWIELQTLVKVIGFPLDKRREPLKNWVITVQARGLEADSPARKFRLSWNGKWNEGENEMVGNLVLQEF